jgi:chorismate mutase
MDATEDLLNEMVSANAIESDDIAAVYFTLTSDLNAEFPAVAARERLGWRLVPLINSIEIDRPGSMRRCVRVLLFLNTSKSQEDIRHIYLRDAVVLRADITDAQ